jgi:hypothetical protein
MSWTSLIKSVAGALLPKDSDDYVPIRPAPQKKVRFGFGRVIASGVDPAFGTVLAPVGAGMTVSQAAGNLSIASGVNVNQDTLVRSSFTVTDPYTLRWSTVLSQRIVNQQFAVELVDVIGDGLSATILTSTTIRVTLPAGRIAELGWDTRNYGQTVSLGNYTGTGTFSPLNAQAATITTIAGNDVTFTVAAGGLAAGSGTLSVFGWNYHRFTYDATTVTQFRYQSQRNGWPSTAVTYTINTTAAPGHVGILNVEDNIAAIFDMLRASTTGAQASSRGSSVQDMPPNDVPLYLQLRVVNGGTAPASTTTWAIAFVDIDNYIPQQVSIVSARPQSMSAPGVPVTVAGGAISATASPFNATAYSLVTAASTNAAAVGAASSSRKLLELAISNPTATAAYVKIYAKATAPTVGTDIPVMTIPVPAGGFVSWSAPFGKAMSAGIAIAVTGAAAATDTTAAVAGVQIHATFQ